MANVLISTHGTGGDVIPFIKIGRILKKKHDVTIFTHCMYKAQIESENLGFVAIDSVHEYESMMEELVNLDNPLHNKEGTIKFHANNHGVDRCVREYMLMSKYCDDNTIILCRHRTSISAMLLAEKKKIPLTTVFLSPNYIGHIELHEYLLGEEMKNEINMVRKELGIHSIANWSEWLCSPKIKICVWPDWFFPVPDGFLNTGFLSQNHSDSELPDSFYSFLSENPQPVLVTGGTSKMVDKSFYDIAVKGCKIAGESAIVIIPYKEQIPNDIPDNMKVFKELDVGKAMKYVKCVIHHGGMGTSSEALQCAIPQIILPHITDGPDNAYLLRNLGVAKSFPKLRWNPHLIKKALNTIDNPDFRDKCSEISSLMNNNASEKIICNIVSQMNNNERAYELP